MFLRARRRLVGQLYAVTGDLGEAQDVVQEAFVRAWLRWSKLAGYDDPEAWVRRVAMNLAANHWRRLRRVRREPLAGTAPSSLDSEDATATRLQLAAALRDLPVRQREALVLHHLAGLPVAEVASQLGVPEGTVKSWLSRGRRRVVSALSAEDRVLPHGQGQAQ